MIGLVVIGGCLYLIADTVNAGFLNNKVDYATLTREALNKFRRIGPVSALVKYIVDKDVKSRCLPYYDNL